MKRGQGISIKVIVIAAIALLVIVVLIAVFTGRLGSFQRGIETCKGQCVPASQCTVPAPEGECPQEVINNKIGNIIFWTSSGQRVCCLITK